MKGSEGDPAIISGNVSHDEVDLRRRNVWSSVQDNPKYQGTDLGLERVLLTLIIVSAKLPVSSRHRLTHPHAIRL